MPKDKTERPDAPSLSIKFTWLDASNLFQAELDNGATFFVELNMLGGKLAANLALFRDAVAAERKERPHRPIVSRGLDDDTQRMIDEAVAAGRVTKVASAASMRAITLEDLDL